MNTFFAVSVALNFGLAVGMVYWYRVAYSRNHDHLTGLPLRELFYELSLQVAKASNREESVLAVMFGDLDGFKKINDTLGHEVGDRALIDVSRVLRETTRKADVVGRLGGDEFVLACPVQSWSAAEALAAKIQRAMEGLSYSGLPLGISFGIEVIDPAGISKQSLAEALKRADARMYEEKAARKAAKQALARDLIPAMA